VTSLDLLAGADKRALKLKASSSEAELAAAVTVYHDRVDEYVSVKQRLAQLEQLHPWLTGLHERPEELPTGVTTLYNNLIQRADSLAKEVHAFPLTMQTTILKQVETQQKRGLLVTVTSVARFMTRVITIASKYIDGHKLSAFREEAQLVYEDFQRENPAAVLARAGEHREQHES